MKIPMKELIEFSIINLDKPIGPTSFGVDVIVKKMFKATKTSHFGTLDPIVSGVLPIALNRACKLLGFFMHKNKTYVGIMRIHKEISLENLEKEIENFVGKIKQTPPVKSRVKREEREREVVSWKILEQQGKDFLFETEVQAGTYIRKLISDLGEKIGGAHMLELRRVKAGIFSEQDLEFTNLYDLNKAVEEYSHGNEDSLRKILIPASEAIKKIMPQIQVKKDSLKKILHGSPLFQEFLESKFAFREGETFSVFCKDDFIGVYKAKKEGNILAWPQFVKN